MPASYYIATDAPEQGAWDFTREQIAAVVEQYWPASVVTDPFPPNGVIELRIQAEPLKTLITYFPGRFFTFDDQDQLVFPIEVVYRVLAALAPAASAVWSSDSDGDVHPFQLAAGLEAAIADVLAS